MSQPTQSERVLKILKARGEQGTYAPDGYGNGADGLGPITRLSARILELIAEGHKIRKFKVAGTTFQHYSLDTQAPAATTSEPTEPTSEMGALFELPTQRGNHYDYDLGGAA